MSKYAILVSLLAASTLGAGAFAWQTKKTVDSRDHDVQSLEQQVNELTKARDAERDAKDKASAESTAALNASRAELDELRAEHQEAEKRLEAFKALTEKFRKMIDSGKLEVVLRHGRMVVKLPAGVLFASGSAELSKEGKDALKEVTGVLRHISDRRFMVAGHTDNVPVGTPSTFKNNLDLSTSRALVVAQSMISSGMPPARLVAAGYSEYEPVRENSTEAGRKENRRIEIVLMPNVTELPAMPGDKADAGAPVAKADATNADAGAPKAEADAGATTTAKK